MRFATSARSVPYGEAPDHATIFISRRVRARRGGRARLAAARRSGSCALLSAAQTPPRHRPDTAAPRVVRRGVAGQEAVGTRALRCDAHSRGCVSDGIFPHGCAVLSRALARSTRLGLPFSLAVFGPAHPPTTSSLMSAASWRHRRPAEQTRLLRAPGWKVCRSAGQERGSIELHVN